MEPVPPDDKELRQLLADFRQTIDDLGSFIFMKDTGGRYTYANLEVQKLFNCSSEDIIGLTDDAFFSLDQSRDLQENDRRVLVYGQTIEAQERNVVARTGEERFYWSVKRPLIDDDGHIRGMAGISTDITDKIQLEKALSEKQILLETVLDHSPACIYMKDPERCYRYVNQRTATLYGQPPQAILGHRDEDLLPAETAETCRLLDERIIETRKEHADEERFVDAQGNVRIYRSNKVPIFSDAGHFSGFIGFSQDITETHQLQQKLNSLAHEDQLTGLPNRRRTEQILDEEIARAHRSGRPLTLLALDLDHFKWVNDHFGHDVGDEVLIRVGVVLRERLRSTDTLGRWGGEEFFVILPDTDPEGAQRVAETLRQTMESCVRIGETPVTVSIGVTEYSVREDLKAFIQRADDILYRAKHSGRNQVALISSQAALR